MRNLSVRAETLQGLSFDVATLPPVFHQAIAWKPTIGKNRFEPIDTTFSTFSLLFSDFRCHFAPCFIIWSFSSLLWNVIHINFVDGRLRNEYYVFFSALFVTSNVLGYVTIDFFLHLFVQLSNCFFSEVVNNTVEDICSYLALYAVLKRVPFYLPPFHLSRYKCDVESAIYDHKNTNFLSIVIFSYKRRHLKPRVQPCNVHLKTKSQERRGTKTTLYARGKIISVTPKWIVRWGLEKHVPRLARLASQNKISRLKNSSSIEIVILLQRTSRKNM